MKNIYLQILDQKYSGSNFVLATVSRTHGSTPQKPGSSALFSENGLVSGTVGGGIVERKVQQLAFEAAKKKESGHFQFDLTYDISAPDEAICGGHISVLIDADLKKSIPLFEQVKQSMSKRIPGVLITMVTGFNEKAIQINRYWVSDTLNLPSGYTDKIQPVIESMLIEGNPTNYREIEIEVPGDEPFAWVFLESIFPPAKLVIAGAGHVGKALTHMGSLLDFEVTVIDDRPEYANSENLPDADHIIVENVGKAMQELEKAEDTYVVIVTRGHKDDADALKPCIGEDLAYTGMIGSKKKVETIRRNSIEKGWATDGHWDFINAPIGLDIKSQTVEEIAVSIVAQLVLVRNSRNK